MRVGDSRQADLLLQASVQTYQAYNFWGGESLYRDASGTLPHGYASKVSFDRPFDDDRGLGQMLKWEVPMTRFLERYGYDVTFTTSVDVGTGSLGSIDRAGMFLSVGHDEYWAAAERDLLERARDEGVPLAFFSANTGYWRIRYEDPDPIGRLIAATERLDAEWARHPEAAARRAVFGIWESAELDRLTEGAPRPHPG